MAFLLVLVGVVSGQKGGAKGAMRGNRGKVEPIMFFFCEKINVCLSCVYDVCVTTNVFQGGGSRGGRGRGGGREGGVARIFFQPSIILIHIILSHLPFKEGYLTFPLSHTKPFHYLS